MPLEPIAIIGMAATFPGAPNLSAFWRALLQGRCSLQEAPSDRLPPQLFRPESADPAHFYTRRGGFIDRHARFDPLRFGVMPQAARGAEPDQLLALQTCADALRDAGYGRGARAVTPKTDVILGRGGYIGPAMTNLNLRVRTVEQLDQTLAELKLLEPQARAELRARFCERLEHFGPDTAIGLVPNLTAARVAQRLDLQGSAYTIDAACASALISVQRACESLSSGRAELALAGGVHLVHDLTFWSVFTQLGALSRSHSIRPFSRAADGLLIGEGLGVIALKRLEDARRDGDRIYAFIEGHGSSSDGRGATLMSPSERGQRLALEEAWAGIEGRALGLLEAHATATPVGDQVELETIKGFFGSRDQGAGIALGTLKAFIGHTMPASGIAALIKAALSVYHGVLTQTSPSADFEPHEALKEGRLEVIQRARAWEESRPRRAAVNAFGFGGSNAHLVLCHPDALEVPSLSSVSPFVKRPLISHIQAPHALLALAAESEGELISRLSQWSERLRGDREPEVAWLHLIDEQGRLTQSYREGAGPYRAALVDPSPDRLASLIKSARAGRAKRGRAGLWLSSAERALYQGLSPHQLSRGGLPQVAFIYPGVEASFSPQLDDLCAHLGLPSPALSPHSREDKLDLEGLSQRGVGVIRAGLSLTTILQRLGLTPQHYAGHSLGEWAGLVSAGYVNPEHVEQFIAGLDPQGLEVPEVAFIAVGASRERVEATLGEREGLYCSHANCPHQSVFCAPRALADGLVQELNSAQLIAQRLPFESGFHAPYFAPYASRITAHLKRLELLTPHSPLWSSTTCEPYPQPQDPEALYELSDRHLTEPVQFQALTERLYQEGVRVFIQLGVGSISSFVSDTLRGRPHLTLDAHSEHLGAKEQLMRLCAALYVEGYELEIEALSPIGSPARGALSLKLGVPIISLADEQPNPELMRPASAQREARLNEPLAPFDVGPWRGEGTLPAPLSWVTDPSGEGSWRARWPLSIEAQPYLIDHCFFRQPHGWPTLRDRFPVVPMTLSIQWVMEAAQQLVKSHGLKERVVGIEEVRASKWVEVSPPSELEVSAQVSPALSERAEGYRRVTVSLKGHLSAVVLLSERPALSPQASPPQTLPDERQPPLHAAQIYRERWMFHGPAYYGIDELSALSPRGIRGVLRATETPGALLDNVGQLFGLWVMLTEVEDRVVMPVSLDSLTFYGPPPHPGERLPCVVWIEALDKRSVTAHMAIWRQGRLWATLRGWRDWRFETSEALWGLMQYPERCLFARPLSPPLSELTSQPISIALARGVSAGASSREFLVGRCLNQAEQALYRSLPKRAQQDWLAGRIAAKDAARSLLWSLQKSRAPHSPLPPLFPIEVETERLPSGAVGFTNHGAGAALSVSISHKEGLAVSACALRARRVGVDLEPVKARARSWIEASFSEAERRLVEAHAAEHHATLYTALWCAKESLAKATGEGLGSPRAWLAEGLTRSLDPRTGEPCGEVRMSDAKVTWWVKSLGDERPYLIAVAAID